MFSWADNPTARSTADILLGDAHGDAHAGPGTARRATLPRQPTHPPGRWTDPCAARTEASVGPTPFIEQASGGYPKMVSSAYQHAVDKYHHDELTAGLIRNRLIFAWMMCVHRRLSCTSRGSQEPSPCAALPLSAKQLLDGFLGSWTNLIPSFVPASILKNIVHARRSKERLELETVVSLLLAEASPSLMEIARRGEEEGRIVIPRDVVDRINSFHWSVRDNQNAYGVFKKAAEKMGYTVRYLCSCASNSPCGSDLGILCPHGRFDRGLFFGGAPGIFEGGPQPNPFARADEEARQRGGPQPNPFARADEEARQRGIINRWEGPPGNSGGAPASSGGGAANGAGSNLMHEPVGLVLSWH